MRKREQRYTKEDEHLGNISHAEKGNMKLQKSSDNKKRLLGLNRACREKGRRNVGGVRNCPYTSREKAVELVKEFSAKNRDKESKRLASQPNEEKGDNSTMMGVTFAATVQSKLCTDGGSDINLLPSHFFEDLLGNKAEMKVTKYKSPRLYLLAASTKHITCGREVALDRELHIRHGKSLMIRNLRWSVAIEKVKEPLLGRPIQEELGLDVRQVLEAACDRFGGSCNASNLLDAQLYPEGSVARIITNGIYHGDSDIVYSNYWVGHRHVSGA